MNAGGMDVPRRTSNKPPGGGDDISVISAPATLSDPGDLNREWRYEEDDVDSSGYRRSLRSGRNPSSRQQPNVINGRNTIGRELLLLDEQRTLGGGDGASVVDFDNDDKLEYGGDLDVSVISCWTRSGMSMISCRKNPIFLIPAFLVCLGSTVLMCLMIAGLFEDSFTGAVWDSPIWGGLAIESPPICEAIQLDKFVRQPFNALSSISYIIVGAIFATFMFLDLYDMISRTHLKKIGKKFVKTPVLLKRQPIWSFLFAACFFWLGSASYIFHASHSNLGKQFDTFSWWIVETNFVAYAWARFWLDGLTPTRISEQSCMGMNCLIVCSPFAVRLVSYIVSAIMIAAKVSIDIVLFFYIEEISQVDGLGTIILLLLISLLLIPTFMHWWFRSRDVSTLWSMLMLSLFLGSVALALEYFDQYPQFCHPTLFLQAHAFWHLFSALSGFTLYLFFRGDLPIIDRRREFESRRIPGAGGGVRETMRSSKSPTRGIGSMRSLPSTIGPSSVNGTNTSGPVVVVGSNSSAIGGVNRRSSSLSSNRSRSVPRTAPLANESGILNPEVVELSIFQAANLEGTSPSDPSAIGGGLDRGESFSLRPSPPQQQTPLARVSYSGNSNVALIRPNGSGSSVSSSTGTTTTTTVGPRNSLTQQPTSAVRTPSITASNNVQPILIRSSSMTINQQQPGTRRSSSMTPPPPSNAQRDSAVTTTTTMVNNNNNNLTSIAAAPTSLASSGRHQSFHSEAEQQASLRALTQGGRRSINSNANNNPRARGISIENEREMQGLGFDSRTITSGNGRSSSGSVSSQTSTTSSAMVVGANGVKPERLSLTNARSSINGGNQRRMSLVPEVGVSDKSQLSTAEKLQLLREERARLIAEAEALRRDSQAEAEATGRNLPIAVAEIDQVLPPGWFKSTDPFGEVFYFNPTTKATSYQFPTN